MTQSIPKRIGLVAGWFVASYAGTAGSIWLRALSRAGGSAAPWFVTDAVYYLPLAALLVWLVRDRMWALVIVAGLIALAILQHLLGPVVSSLVHPLSPTLLSSPLAPFRPPPRIDYLAVWMAYYTLIGVLVGLIELAFLWPYLKPAWMWPIYKAIAGPVTALALLWQLFLPVPGGSSLASYRWDWPPVLVSAIGFALLWRFKAKVPRLSWPPFRLPVLEDEVDPVYAARIAELEQSLKRGQA